MLLPVFIFLMILSPVLLPASITAVDAISRAFRRTQNAGDPSSLASRRATQPSPDIWLVYEAPGCKTAVPYQ